jgi:ABC-type antimicrobial peptide transport system permease subunit
VAEGLAVALAGVGCGLLAAVVAGRALTSFVFGIGTADPLTLGGVSLLLLCVATTASYLPARRALKVDPVIALRAD